MTNSYRIRSVAHWALGLLAFLAIVNSFSQAAARLPDPPDAAQQAKARATVEQLFASDLSKGDAASLEKLASRFCGDAKTADDPVSRYVLLDEARKLDLKAGNIPAALAAIDQIASAYAISALKMKDQAFQGVSPRILSTSRREMARLAGRLLAEQNLAAEQIEDAQRIVKTVSTLAAGRPADVVASTRNWEAEMDALIQLTNEYGIVAKRSASGAAETASGNTLAGKYLCLIDNDWAAGLPKLAKGADPSLASAARQEIQDMASGELASVSTANAWLDAAAKQPPSLRPRFAAHSLSLYRTANPGISGLTKEMAEKRMAEARKLSAATWVVDLLALADPVQDAVGDKAAWQFVKNSLVGAGKTPAALFQFPYRPPAEYDFAIEYSRISGGNDVIQILARGDNEFQFVDGAGNSDTCWFGKFAGKQWNAGEQTVPSLRRPGRHRCVVQVRDDAARVIIDGAEVPSLSTDYTGLGPFEEYALNDRTVLGIGCWQTTVAFDAVEVVEIKGQGEIVSHK